ncbi:hypothetical protein K505DRAFT_257400 [Melanomma pulvis-pyrius CBS 109.77]|uniref:Metallothionein n=1 Tax=Melanomma pulvis-pyrius CBS 109.77 TaxID=1314802 RepID=A0A6A6WUK8_9PLEO|nr:hypothetical protein K505DRAFT_257400 [Melanomma pulvis-pyrius CBS 109.77]
MKASMIIAFLSAVVVMASPAAVSLNRSTREVIVDDAVEIQSCVECPCSGFDGSCQCVSNGCCCPR